MDPKANISLAVGGKGIGYDGYAVVVWLPKSWEEV